MSDVCPKCNKYKRELRNKNGKRRPLCVRCRKGPDKHEKMVKDNYNKHKKKYIQNNHIRRRPYIIHKKSVCERCKFIPEHKSQLDVDHIDGNHKNNNIDNLQTLCANCHRLKTAQTEQKKKQIPVMENN